MKLSVISDKESEETVANIAEYANTQNKVNAADLRSNHPYHARIEQFSRNIWAPPREGQLVGTKWFYERSRGQYQDEQSRMTPGEKNKFRVISPPAQKFTKTDLAKFDNVWDEKPFWVNRGAQKNFIQYALRIGKEWSNDSEQFNEAYYHRAVARAIVFKATERLVSAQTWYAGGYRANIVAYTLSTTSALAKRHGKRLDFKRVWREQALEASFTDQLAVIARYAHDVLHMETRPVWNCSEWAKKEEFWPHLENALPAIDKQLTDAFWAYFVPA